MSRTIRAALLTVTVTLGLASPAAAADLVISEVYGAGGNAGSDYPADYVEIFNRGTAPVSLDGRSLQYASATGTGNFSSTTLLGGTLQPGRHLLAQGSTPATPPVAGDVALQAAMGATGGKLVLVEGVAALPCNGSSDPCTAEERARVIDLVGYGNANFFEGIGPAQGATTTTATLRRADGCAETDDNAADFAPGEQDPDNRASAATPCTPDPGATIADTDPGNGATEVPVDTDIRVTFSEPVAADESSFSIACGSGGPRAFVLSTSDDTTYTLNPAEPLPNGRSCTVTVDTAEADGSFSFTTEGLRLRIREIQGARHLSEYDDQLVSLVPGVVTARRSNGFYIQDPEPDDDARTSEGIFVFTGSAPPASAAVGAPVQVSGAVDEFRPGGSGGLANLTITEIVRPSVTPGGTGAIEPTVVGAGGRVPPTEVIDDDSMGDVEQNLSGFDPEQDGIDFYESLEGMLTQVNDAVAVGPRNDFGEIPVLADNGAGAGVRTPRGGIVIRANDFNPERIQLDDVIRPTPRVNVRDGFEQDVRAVVDYSFGNFKLLVLDDLTRRDGGLAREVTAAPHRSQLATATLNVENLDPADGPAKFTALARQIVGNLQSPDLLSLEEVQDDNGPVNDAVTDATGTYTALIAAIAAEGGPAYHYRQIDPVDDQDGGEPGGNIRVAFLFRTDRGLSFVDRAGGSSTNATGDDPDQRGAQLKYSPGRIDPTNPAFNTSRKPLAGEFRFRGRKLFAVANHFNSKGGDDPLFGRFQPPKRTSEVQRHEQARIVNAFVKELVRADPTARVIVLGDLNDFDFSETLRILKGREMFNLMDLLPRAEKYSYDFEGNSQVLDQILVTWPLLLRLPQYDSVHVNSEFHDQVSDHEPQVARLWFPGDPR